MRGNIVLTNDFELVVVYSDNVLVRLLLVVIKEFLRQFLLHDRDDLAKLVCDWVVSLVQNVLHGLGSNGPEVDFRLVPTDEQHGQGQVRRRHSQVKRRLQA